MPYELPAEWNFLDFGWALFHNPEAFLMMNNYAKESFYGRNYNI